MARSSFWKTSWNARSHFFEPVSSSLSYLPAPFTKVTMPSTQVASMPGVEVVAIIVGTFLGGTFPPFPKLGWSRERFPFSTDTIQVPSRAFSCSQYLSSSKQLPLHQLFFINGNVSLSVVISKVQCSPSQQG